MYEQGEEREWRENRLLAENTLLSIITFPPELFYPIGVHTIGIIVKKGIPHPRNQNVLWVRAIHDGLEKMKGKRLPSSTEPNDLKTVKPIAKAFIHNPSFPIESIPEFYKATPINFSDPLLELVPEAHLDSKQLAKEELRAGVDELTRETVSFLIRTRRD